MATVSQGSFGTQVGSASQAGHGSWQCWFGPQVVGPQVGGGSAMQRPNVVDVIWLAGPR